MDYICGYCGKAYPTVGERMECEKKCYEKKIQEEENLKASKREEEMKKDYASITDLVKERDALDEKIKLLVRDFDKKYNVITPINWGDFFDPFKFWFRG
jgi:hypothetical protein